jgi:acetyl-CoA acetyltransferase
MDYAKRMGQNSPVKISAISTVTPTFANAVVERPDIATDSAAAQGIEALRYRSSIPAKAYEEAGIRPEDVSVAEVYDLSSALELDWYEDLQFCPRGDGAKLIRDGVTQLGGKLPVNTSGGLACFGEAVPAQALAQVCELTWQLRDQAGERQVDGAKVGITANQGLFGHGSSVIVTK